MWKTVSLFVMLIIIGGISSIDTALTVQYRCYMEYVEENPCARIIMEADDWNISKFIGLKMGGTIIVLLTIMAIYFYDKSKALIIALSLTIFQLLLLAYLLC